VPVHTLDAAIDRLPNPTDRLAPTEVLLDAFADNLACPIPGVPRGAPVDCAKQPVEPLERCIHEQPNRPQRMIGWHEVFQLYRREQRFLHLIHSAHRAHRLDLIITAGPRSPFTSDPI